MRQRWWWRYGGCYNGMRFLFSRHDMKAKSSRDDCTENKKKLYKLKEIFLFHPLSNKFFHICVMNFKNRENAHHCRYLNCMCVCVRQGVVLVIKKLWIFPATLISLLIKAATASINCGKFIYFMRVYAHSIYLMLCII